MSRTVTALATALVLSVALTIVMALAVTSPGPAPLPSGFTVQQADGITYVCSVRPVQCTGNLP